MSQSPTTTHTTNNSLINSTINSSVFNGQLSETMISDGIAFAKFGHQHTVCAQFGMPLKHWSHSHRAAFSPFSVNEFVKSLNELSEILL